MKLSNFLSLVFFLSIIQMACHTTKDVADDNANTACSQTGFVKDFQGMDGCGLLIVVDGGQKLQPINIDDFDISLQSGQKVLLDYNKEEDAMTACMNGIPVHITCITSVGKGQVRKKECFNIIEKPMEVEWMKKIITKHQPKQVIKYMYRTDGWAYLLTGKNIFLYDCQGTLICAERSKEDCLKLVEYESLNNGVIVWDGMGSND